MTILQRVKNLSFLFFKSTFNGSVKKEGRGEKDSENLNLLFVARLCFGVTQNLHLTGQELCRYKQKFLCIFFPSELYTCHIN